MNKQTANGSAPVVLVVLLVWCAVLGCGALQVRAGEDDTVIVIRGTGSLTPLVDRWVRSYSTATPAISFDYRAEGTGESIADLLAGRAGISAVLRPLNAEEQAASLEKGLSVRSTVVARTGIAVVVHSSNPVASIQVQQLAGVFAGEIQSWKVLGGPDEKITVIHKTTGRSPIFFRERVMAGKQYLSGGLIVDSKKTILKEVSQRPWAIGFTGMPEAMPAMDRINLLRLESDTSDGGSTYALSRPLYFHTAGDSSAVQAFLEYVSSIEAQEEIVDTGFFPARQRDQLEDAQ